MAREPSSRFCAAYHACRVEDCHKPRETSRRLGIQTLYCADHECCHSGCTALSKGSGGGYCVKHACTEDGCKNAPHGPPAEDPKDNLCADHLLQRKNNELQKLKEEKAGAPKRPATFGSGSQASTAAPTVTWDQASPPARQHRIHRQASGSGSQNVTVPRTGTAASNGSEDLTVVIDFLSRFTSFLQRLKSSSVVTAHNNSNARNDDDNGAPWSGTRRLATALSGVASLLSGERKGEVPTKEYSDSGS